MGRSMTIALNMIVGPYEEPFLQAAIASCYSLCDEFVFVDTAPGNNPSRQLLEEFKENMCVNAAVFDDPYKPVKIIDMPRGEDKDFSFSEARELARVNTESEWVLRLDADEVLHEDTIFDLKYAINTTTQPNWAAIEVAFYHFMVYPWLYQYVEPKVILMKKDSFTWRGGVHEQPKLVGKVRRIPELKYFHYGYCRGQAEVFKRWKLYTDIDGRPNWYDNTDPSSILSDRISVCQNFTGEHPKVVRGVLNELFKDVVPFQIREIPRYRMSDNHIGLLLLTFNDAENLVQMIKSLEETVDMNTHIQVIDMGSTDGTIDILHQWIEKSSPLNFKINSIDLSCWTKLHSLTKTMNVGFKSLLSRQECEYIGWIHPDMVFTPGWLSELVATLQVHPEIGKICSFNSRDGQPNTDEIFEGQEQAYIVRRGVLLKVGLFDENFIGIGGYEDWDLNNRIRQEGFKVAITPKSQVWHKGMATRERRDTTDEQVHNRGVYITKWGISTECMFQTS
jgi:glycosyltransferase involved in cell wall biosynthesis